MSCDGDSYQRCESCDLLAFEPQTSEMPGESNGQKLCLSCRRTCDTCKLVGASYEDFADRDTKTCVFCVRAEDANEERFTAHHEGGITPADIERRELREAGR